MELKLKTLKLSKSLIPSLIVQVFYLLYFIRMIVGSSTVYGTVVYGLMSLIGVSVLGYILATKKLDNKYKIIAFILLFYVFGIISSLYTDNYRIQDYLIILQYMGIGLLLFKYKLNYSVNKFFFAFYSVYFGVNLAMGVHPDTIFIGFSRNNIPIIFLIQAALLYISLYKQGLKMKIYPVIILCLFSFWTIGRSGIFVAVLLLFLVVTYIQFKSGKKFIKFMYFSAGLFVLYTVFSIFFYEDLIKPALERLFQLGVSDSHRGNILTEYFYQIKYSIYAFLFGVSLNDNSVFSVYGYNLHNSYLRLHAYHGLLGFGIVFGFILKSMFKFMLRKQYVYFSLLVVVLIRASTDIAAFHGPFDPLLYFFIFEGVARFRKRNISMLPEEIRENKLL